MKNRFIHQSIFPPPQPRQKHETTPQPPQSTPRARAPKGRAPPTRQTHTAPNHLAIPPGRAPPQREAKASKGTRDAQTFQKKAQATEALRIEQPSKPRSRPSHQGLGLHACTARATRTLGRCSLAFRGHANFNRQGGPQNHVARQWQNGRRKRRKSPRSRHYAHRATPPAARHLGARKRPVGVSSPGSPKTNPVNINGHAHSVRLVARKTRH